MQFYRINKVCFSSFFAIATASVFLLSSGVVQAKCTFFTGFADNKDGTVTDTRNGLIWKRCAEGFAFSNGECTGEGTKANWEDAKLMAHESRFLDKSDWRLPTKEEFEVVLSSDEKCANNQNGEYAASKAIAHSGGLFWSASPSDDFSSYAWYVNFSNGNFYGNGRYQTNYVRLVRAGQLLGGEAALEFLSEPADKARIEAERRRMDEEHRRAEAPNILKAMSKDNICVAYGSALREGKVDGIGSLPEITKLVKRELVRRKFKLEDSLVRKRSIKIGISECQLYASWGMPEDQNRTVGGWGVHIQHVYGSGTYVYTENGRVTSWQD